MTGPAVRVVYRVTLPVEGGRIMLGELRGAAGAAFPPGSAVVLEVGSGRWMTRADVAELAGALAGVAHVSVTGTGVPWERGTADEWSVVGLDAIGVVIERCANRAGGRTVGEVTGPTRGAAAAA